MILLGQLQPSVTNWLTPLWVLSLGAAVGLVGLLVCWSLLGLLAKVWPNVRLRGLVRDIPLAVSEGVLWPLTYVLVGFTGFALVGYFAATQPAGILASVANLPFSGVRSSLHEIEARQVPEAVEGATRADLESLVEPQQLEVAINMNEISRLELVSNSRLQVAVAPFELIMLEQVVSLEPEKPYVFRRGRQSAAMMANPQVDHLYIRNVGETPAQLKVTVTTAVAHPEVLAVPITAVLIILVYVFYFAHRTFLPKLSAIALATYKSEVAQPIFVITCIVGACLLLLFYYIPYNTFGEDIKILKDQGLTLIMLLSILVAVAAASTSVSDEIEGRTALTVLSKPVGRPAFVLGKLLGVSWVVFVMYVVLGALFLVLVAGKPIYEAAESSRPTPLWQACYFEMVQIVPGLALAMMESVVIAALSVAISTRLPLLANVSICLVIYVLGHLTPLIVKSSVGKFPIVRFFGQLIAVIFPNLDHFNIQAAVSSGTQIPYQYLGWSLLYCAIYTVIAVLLALLMFEDRDLA